MMMVVASKTGLSKQNGVWSKKWDKIAAFTFGVTFFIVMLGVSVALPSPTETQWFVFRVILAAAAAGFGAVVPGLIIVHVGSRIRAGGAIALFVLVYAVNPPKLIERPQDPVTQIATDCASNTSGSGNSTTVNCDKGKK